MTDSEYGDRLVSQGLLIFIVALVGGAFIPVFTNPRMGVAAHLGGVTTGTFVVVAGLVWARASFEGSTARNLFGVMMYGAWGTVAGLVWAAVFGTSRSTPLAGAGHSGAPWAEAVADVLLSTASVAMLVACVWLWRRVGAR